MSAIKYHVTHAVGIATLGLLAACGGTNPYVLNRNDLDAGQSSLASGDPGGAVRPLESVVIRTNDDSDPFALQRYFAAYLLTRASLEQAASMAHSTRDDAWLSPAVATTYYWAFAQDWAVAAEASGPKSEDGDVLLPEGLAGLGVDGSRSYLELARLVVAAWTKFQDEVVDLVGREPALREVATTEQLADAVALSPAVRPWLFWSLFEYYKTRNQPRAYEFGIRARELGRDALAKFPADYSDEIVHWILHESDYVFKSSAGVEFDPGVDECSQTGEPNIEFRAERRSG